MVKKFDVITKLYEEATQEVTESPEKWIAFLQSASKNYRLPFDEQLLIHVQRPEATAVLPMEKWNEKFGRWVKRDSKGIAVFDKSSDRLKLKYYFDVSDTREGKYKRLVRPVSLWSVAEEQQEPVKEALVNTFGVTDGDRKEFAMVILEASLKLETFRDNIEYEVIEKGSAGFLGINRKDAVIRARKKNDTNDNIRDFLESVFKAMGLTVTIQIEKEEDSNVVNVNLKGDDMGVLIGKRGQTLDALQYLTNLAVNKNSEEYVKVKIDTEDYRKRRRETLENLAKNIAYKVKRTKRPVSLEPMNPFERRVIHSTLQNDKFVTTHSEGEEPYRHVVVTLKK